MLRQRIGAERDSGDADRRRHAGDGGGSVVDQLARARLPPLAPLPCRAPAGWEFRIDRHSNRQIAFGPHVCLGTALLRLELTV